MVHNMPYLQYDIFRPIEILYSEVQCNKCQTIFIDKNPHHWLTTGDRQVYCAKCCLVHDNYRYTGKIYKAKITTEYIEVKEGENNDKTEHFCDGI